MIVALDTNFLVYCAKQKIDFLSEIGRLCSEKTSIIVPELAIQELENLSEMNSEDGKYALLALQLAKGYITKGRIAVEFIRAETADDALLNLDKKNNAIATLDLGLRRRIKNARIIVVRQLNHLEFA